MEIQKYIEMPQEMKWWQEDSLIPNEINDVPIVENCTMVKNSEFIELQNNIDKLVYEFMQKHNIPNGFSLGYGIDNINDLKEFGTEYPSCDRFMCIYDENKKAIITSM